MWTDRDATAIDEMFVPERHGVVGLAKAAIGPKEFRSFWDMMTAALRDTRVVIEQLWVANEESVFFARMLATSVRGGKSIDVRFSGHAVVKEGKIVEATNVVDFLALMQQLGALEADALVAALAV
ncbi:MAG: nuclear transport factor 2 family protein [Nannocystaceae bacterium]|nr:nuclear transport factor 2 family protein [Nannocystaceae bacterium]